MNPFSVSPSFPRGFLACGVSSGIKRGKPDLGLIFSEIPCAAAGVLTRNRLRAAPVLLAQETLRRRTAQGIIANSGNANCCTGPRGIRDALDIRRQAAALLSIPPRHLFVASTGVIGRFLPVRKIEKALPKLVGGLRAGGFQSAAHAILTTDLAEKSLCVKFSIGRRAARIGGIAKGSGMIDPAMATMLSFLMTDCDVPASLLQGALREAVADSFNAITIDGQMSTNDMVILLANGASGVRLARGTGAAWNVFQKGLARVALELAKKIVRDGEGASRFATVVVKQARSQKEAFHAAKAIANAPLVKTMIAGQDPNWGRVAATVGATGIPVSPKRLTIALSGVTVFRNGAPLAADRLLLRQRFSQPEVSIEAGLGRGRAQARVYTCDLTQEYVRINAKYS